LELSCVVGNINVVALTTVAWHGYGCHLAITVLETEGRTRTRRVTKAKEN